MNTNIFFETDCDRNDSDELHIHDHAELIFSLSGNCSVFSENRSFVLKSEDFAVLNPFETHRLEREEGCHTLSLYIPTEILSDCGIGTVDCVSSLQPEKKATLDLIRMHLANIWQDFSVDKEKMRLNIQAELLELLSILLQDFTDENENKSKQSDKNKTDALRKQNILRFVWEHYREEISLSLVAEKFHLSDGYFSRLFTEMTGKVFSSYLREIRLNHAKNLIESGEASVTLVAFSSGFGSVNTFIEAFKKKYGITPGAYIRKNEKKENSENNAKPKNPTSSKTDCISYMGLLRYRSVEKSGISLRQSQSEIIEASFSEKTKPLNRVWIKNIGIGYAKNLFWGVIQASVIRAEREFKFGSYLFHGIYDDELHICQRNQDGSISYNFYYIDLALNFLVNEMHITPWIVLDYTPNCLAGNSPVFFGTNVVSLPENLDEWRKLIVETLKHFIVVFGKKEVEKWKFSMEQAVQISVGNIKLENYKPFYLETFRAIRSVLPNADIFAFGLDTGHISLNPELFSELLTYAKENGALPNLISVQSFLCDFKNSDNLNTIYDKSIDEVYPISEDPDILSKDLDVMKSTMKRLGINIPIYIMMFNPGMWGQAPGNDTCFHGACIVKNVIENRDKADVFCMGNLTDFGEKMLPDNTMYHGGNGLLTNRAIPKAPYSAAILLNKLVGDVLSEGDGYILTKTEDGKEFTLLLYYYCPYNLSRHRRRVLSPLEETNYDRYYEFDDKGAKSVRIFLKDLISGAYTLETFSVNREHGSSYDSWMQMGAPMKTDKLLGYLEYRSIFEISVSHENADANGELIISALLEPHEVRVIHGTLLENI